MHIEAVYLLNDTFAGTSSFDCPSQPHNLAYFCPVCGKIWARVITGGGWTVETAPCEKHTPSGVPDWGRIPGSFLLDSRSSKEDLSTMWWGRAIEHLPSPLIQREFFINLNAYERALRETIAP